MNAVSSVIGREEEKVREVRPGVGSLCSAVGVTSSPESILAVISAALWPLK